MNKKDFSYSRIEIAIKKTKSEGELSNFTLRYVLDITIAFNYP